MGYVENTHDTAEKVKRFWKKYGNIIVTIILVIMLGIVGLQYWHKRENKIAEQASVVYQNLLSAVAVQKTAQMSGLANQLISEYSSSPYAKLAAFIEAEQAVNNNKLPVAVKKLTWVVEHAKSDSIKSIAQIRLARVLIAQRKASQALSVLNSIAAKEFKGEASVIKGDAYLALKKMAEAKQAYNQALKETDKNSALYVYAEMKLYRL